MQLTKLKRVFFSPKLNWPFSLSAADMCVSTRIFKTCIFVVPLPRTTRNVFNFNGLMEKCKQKFPTEECVHYEFWIVFHRKSIFHFTIAYCVWRKPLFKCQCKFWFDSQMSFIKHLSNLSLALTLIRLSFLVHLSTKGGYKVPYGLF